MTEMNAKSSLSLAAVIDNILGVHPKFLSSVTIGLSKCSEIELMFLKLNLPTARRRGKFKGCA